MGPVGMLSVLLTELGSTMEEGQLKFDTWTPTSLVGTDVGASAWKHFFRERLRSAVARPAP